MTSSSSTLDCIMQVYLRNYPVDWTGELNVQSSYTEQIETSYRNDGVHKGDFDDDVVTILFKLLFFCSYIWGVFTQLNGGCTIHKSCLVAGSGPLESFILHYTVMVTSFFPEGTKPMV